MSATVPRPGVFVLAMGLVLLGLAGSIYLSFLDMRVLSEGGEAGSSFCAINEQFNCLTVARSKYAFFLNIPVAFYGVEFFLLELGILLFSKIKNWPLKFWESYLFWLSGLSIPAVVLLIYISIVLVRSLCPVCMAVNGANLILFISILAANRSAVSRVVSNGPRELLNALKSNMVVRIIVLSMLVFAISQLFWLPLFLPSSI